MLALHKVKFKLAPGVGTSSGSRIVQNLLRCLAQYCARTWTYLVICLRNAAQWHLWRCSQSQEVVSCGVALGCSSYLRQRGA
jgi:hypothetical protein